MRLALNIGFLTRKQPIETVAKLVSDAGFNGVDYSLMEMVDPDCVFNSKDWLRISEALGAVLRDAGIPAVQTHAPFRFSDNVERNRPAISCGGTV